MRRVLRGLALAGVVAGGYAAGLAVVYLLSTAALGG